MKPTSQKTQLHQMHQWILYLCQHILELDDLGPQLLLGQQLLRLHLLDLSHVRVLARLQRGPRQVFVIINTVTNNHQTIAYNLVFQE